MRFLPLLLGMGLLAACAAPPDHAVSLLTAWRGVAPAPQGQREYCDAAARRDDPDDLPFREAFCGPPARREVADLTAARRRDIELVQRSANRAIRYAPGGSWDPLALVGDCKNYVARKELDLLRLGWPAGALRVATVFVNDNGRHQNTYHAVLLVDTKEGTFALDNRYAKPLPWEALPYLWVSVSTPEPVRWTRLAADPLAISAALAANGIGPASGEAAVDGVPAFRLGGAAGG